MYGILVILFASEIRYVKLVNTYRKKRLCGKLGLPCEYESYTIGQGLKWILFWYIFYSCFIWNYLYKGKAKLANIEIFKNIFKILHFTYNNFMK